MKSVQIICLSLSELLVQKGKQNEQKKVQINSN